MTKYDESFKLEMVKKYLAGKIGCKTLAQQAGMSASHLMHWVNAYQEHGRDGLSKKFSHYSVDFKLNVLAPSQAARAIG